MQTLLGQVFSVFLVLHLQCLEQCLTDTEPMQKEKKKRKRKVDERLNKSIPVKQKMLKSFFCIDFLSVYHFSCVNVTL